MTLVEDTFRKGAINLNNIDKFNANWIAFTSALNVGIGIKYHLFNHLFKFASF